LSAGGGYSGLARRLPAVRLAGLPASLLVRRRRIWWGGGDISDCVVPCLKASQPGFEHFHFGNSDLPALRSPQGKGWV